MQVTQITPNFAQGTISTANSPTDIAIQGDGFFIVQAQNGGQEYHPQRHIHHQTPRKPTHVTGTGNRVMGYGINNQFQVDTTELQPLQIPLGTAMVAKATSQATLQGALTPSGTISNTAEIIQTGVLTERQQEPYPGSDPNNSASCRLTAALALDSHEPAAGRKPYRHVQVLRHLYQWQRGKPAAVTAHLVAAAGQQPSHALQFSDGHIRRVDRHEHLPQRERPAGRHELLRVTESCPHEHVQSQGRPTPGLFTDATGNRRANPRPTRTATP